MSKKVALITGVTGQDGSYLAEFLLEKGFLDFIVNRKDLKQKLDDILTYFTMVEPEVEVTDEVN